MGNLDKNFNSSLVFDPADYPARDIMYDFSQAYQKYMDRLHDFDNGKKMTSVEAHTLKHICQNEGVTISDIVNYWGRTKGTVSAQITNLEKKGYVYRKKCKHNSKKVHIFPTEKGLAVNDRHTKFDIVETRDWLEKWTQLYDIEEMKKLMEYLSFYTDFLNEKIKEK